MSTMNKNNPATSSSHNTITSSSSNNSKEMSHYVVTAHPPGSVLMTVQCSFLSPESQDVLVAKSGRLEVRQWRPVTDPSTPSSSLVNATAPFPVALSVPINGRITSLQALSIPAVSSTALIFFTTERLQYAVISYDPSVEGPYPIQTHASGSLSGEAQNILGRLAETGPLVAVDPYQRCVALHLYDGLLTILPLDRNYKPPLRGKSSSASNKGPEGTGTAPESSNAPRSARPQLLGEAFHCRIEERVLLAMTFLQTAPQGSHGGAGEALPHLCVLHQDARGTQHVVTHLVNVRRRQLHLYGSHSAPASTEWLKKSSVDGGSSLLMAVPPRLSAPPVAAAASLESDRAKEASTAPASHAPAKIPTGGVVVIGQRQFTYIGATMHKAVPVPQALYLTYTVLPPDPAGMPRYLLGDEFGNLHMLTLMIVADRVVALQLDTLGSCAIASSLAYLGDGLVFVGSSMGDSQLIQVHDEPIALEDDSHPNIHDPDHDRDLDLMDTTYLSVLEEYTQLGPILDFDLVPTTPGVPGSTSADVPLGQSQVVTASGTSKSGTLRLIRNGIGMNEYACVEIPGIQNMWSLRKSWSDTDDAYLVQSFVGETRVLGVTTTSSLEDIAMMSDTAEAAEVAGTLEEVVLPGLESAASTLYVGNVQVGDRLLQITEKAVRLISLPPSGELLDSWEGSITVASANQAGQIAVALQGGKLVYLTVENDKLFMVYEKQMDREISCIDLHPFSDPSLNAPASHVAMDVETESLKAIVRKLAPESHLVAVGLWDDFTVRLLSLDDKLEEVLCINLSTDEEEEVEEVTVAGASRRSRNNMMARSLCLVTLDFSSSISESHNHETSSEAGVNMLFVGLGDGTLISFAVIVKKGSVGVRSKKEVCLGTQRIDLIPLHTERGGTCVLATGDRPTVIYLAGVGGSSSSHFNPKLCYSNVNLAANDEEEGDDVSKLPSQQAIAVNVAASFFSPHLFDAATMGNQHYSLCVADDAHLRLGVIDDIQKLHVTTCRLGMAPRRIVHCPDGRLFAVGCVESGIKHFGLGGDEANMGNCIRFMDDATFDDLDRIDLEPFEMVLSMAYVTLKLPPSMEATAVETITSDNEQSSGTNAIYKPFLLVGTAYAIPDEDEPTRGRILVYSCVSDEATNASSTKSRVIRLVTELAMPGGVYSLCQFYHGRALCTVNNRAQMLRIVEETNSLRLETVGMGHYGHTISLFVKSRAGRSPFEGAMRVNAGQGSQPMHIDVSDEGADSGVASVPRHKRKTATVSKNEDVEMLGIVGDLMRSISLVQFYPQHETLEEIARDFNANWTTAIEMLNDNIYLGAENWNHLYCLRRNPHATAEEIRCRLDVVGEFHLGEMVNKFMRGSLVMPASSSSGNTNGSSGNGSGSNVGTSSRRNIRRAASPKKPKADAGSPAKGGRVAIRRPVVVGSQTLFGTVDGSLGMVLGLDGPTAAFFETLERCMSTVIRPVGDLSHQLYRAYQTDRRTLPHHGFIDGDLVESFLDLDRHSMEAVVVEMNRDGGWEVDKYQSLDQQEGGAGTRTTLGATDQQNESGRGVSGVGEGPDTDDALEDRAELFVDDVVAMVEEMTMLH